MASKKLFFRIVFGVEIILFSCFYVFGARGLHVLWRLRHVNSILP